MGKGLQALKRSFDSWKYLKEYETIEKELKEYESMKQTQIVICGNKITDDDFEKLKNQRLFVELEPSEVKPLFDETTEKKLKALEIIKRISFYDNYFLDYLLSENKITQEEYDLLKEVIRKE